MYIDELRKTSLAAKLFLGMFKSVINKTQNCTYTNSCCIDKYYITGKFKFFFIIALDLSYIMFVCVCIHSCTALFICYADIKTTKPYFNFPI